MNYLRNPVLENELLPVDIVLAPDWWYKHAGITFDSDYFYHPDRRVEDERKMERMLHERYGEYGLGDEHERDLPHVGAVHLAAGFLVSEMLGCEVEYREDAPPQVLPADREDLSLDADAAFETEAYRRFERLAGELEHRHGYVCGDVNWGGILNSAMDLRGQSLMLDFADDPRAVGDFLRGIGEVIDRFATNLQERTGTTSISVNRNVRNLRGPVFLHSECSHTMISNADYREHLMDFDVAWSRKFRPFGIHYCGTDPHRYAEDFAALPHLDFLDVGWGGDVAMLRKHLPHTFLNIRYSPVELVSQTPNEVRETVTKLVRESANPWLTGVCAINMDANVPDANIRALLEAVRDLRAAYGEQVAET